MRSHAMAFLGAFALMAGVLALAGCGQAAQNEPSGETVVPEVSVQSNGVEIVEVAETQPYRMAAVKGESGVEWAEGSLYSGQDRFNSSMADAEAAIKSSARRLATVDYSALSLPAFVTVTRSLKLNEADLMKESTSLFLDSLGKVNGTDRWAMYGWQGPQIPQLPDMPLVFRWVQIYALYDLGEKRVVRLVATIRGEAHE
jgi:hypothetical protein